MEFFEKYAGVEGSDDDNSDAMSVADDNEVNLSDEEFIDDETNFEDQAPPDYCLTNFTCDLVDAMQEFGLIAPDLQNFVPNYIDEKKFEYNKFKDFEKRIIKF